MKRALILQLLLITALLVLAVTGPALAAEGGKGWIGEETDRIVTAFGLGLIVLIPLILIVLNTIQNKLDKRRETKIGSER